MAWTFINNWDGANFTSSSSPNCNFDNVTYPVTEGDLLVCALWAISATSPWTSVTDDQSNTWTEVTSVSNGTFTLTLFTAIAGSTTTAPSQMFVTGHASSAYECGMIIGEFSNPAGFSIDATVTNTGNSGSPASGRLDVNYDFDLALAFFAVNSTAGGSSTWTAGTGFNNAGSTDPASLPRVFLDYCLTPSKGTIADNATFGTSAPWTAIALSMVANISGVVADGSAIPAATYNLATTGNGAVGNGSAIQTQINNLTTDGNGAVGGGAAIVSDELLMLGGALGGGTAIQTMVFIPTITGNGAIAGGSAIFDDDEGDFVASGGALGGGTAIQTMLFNPTVTGNGALAGGSALFGLTFFKVASGGALGGGFAPFWGVQNLYGSGGVVCSDSATFANGYQYRETLTIAAGKVQATLHNVVFRCNLWIDPTLAVQSRYLFTDANGNNLSSMKIYDDEEGDVAFFVKATIFASVPTTLYVYFA